jgi:hypothetical protein
VRRSPLPRRTKPLERGTPPARTALPPRAKRLSPRSKKREAELAEQAIVRNRVFARDRWQCQMATVLQLHHQSALAAGPCVGQLTFHHLRKASGLGAYTEANGLTLCAGHNGWVEDHPLHATELGLVRRG